ncbi:metalloenzyme domain protein [Deinococcus radiophilus]|uniref:Metalloenzyme domain protein n=1 Tax=Deinococcus radiophilus TaxID=32062 RepID=A0A431VPZ9_9DEIO|nr:metalloenzyme domain protein [Deinococcus radiophilus]RTR25244.1 metalloenzyme domain protein [Deinococcus radiophilus]UFA50266.1 metalloenzyme domain protein [Deinococcus radiophilus]
MTALIWLALDGVGHPADALPESVWNAKLPTLRPLVEAGLALDAGLGVPGLPQSATGQACWLTGQDAVRYMGEHFGPQPGPTLRRLLDQASWPVQLTRAGGRAGLANFYPPGYFERHLQRPRHGCFPYSVLSAGLPLNPPDLPPVLPTLGLSYAAPWAPQHPLADIAALGEALARAAAPYDLVMCDLWLGDLIGHSGAPELPSASLRAGQTYLQRVDALLEGLLAVGAKVLLSSDHGNLENLQTKSHTQARVPLAWAGVLSPQVSDIVEAGQWVGQQLELTSTPSLFDPPPS